VNALIIYNSVLAAFVKGVRNKCSLPLLWEFFGFWKWSVRGQGWICIWLYVCMRELLIMNAMT